MCFIHWCLQGVICRAEMLQRPILRPTGTFIRKQSPEEGVRLECFYTRFEEEWKVMETKSV